MGTVIAQTAVVDPRAKIGANVRIGHFCVIGPDVSIGDNTLIEDHVVISGVTSIGEDNHILPGAVLGAGEIINSNHYALTAMIKTWGGEPIYGGCLPDEKGPVIKAFDASADIIVPIGGASVGDYDVVKPAFLDAGGDIHFEKIAVRPGKPTWYGSIEQKGDRHRKANLTRIIGLPGNPASAIVTAALFLQPLVRVMAGHYSRTMRGGTAQLAAPLSKNGGRETYLRGRVEMQAGAGQATVVPFPNQDSSLLSPFASANVLIRRMPGAEAALEGETVDIVWLR